MPEMPENRAGDPNFMTSLERGLQVIRAFSEHRRNLTISQVAQTTGLSRAAVRRCLYTLHKLAMSARTTGASRSSRWC